MEQKQVLQRNKNYLKVKKLLIEKTSIIKDGLGEGVFFHLKEKISSENVRLALMMQIRSCLKKRRKFYLRREATMTSCKLNSKTTMPKILSVKLKRPKMTVSI